MYLLRIRVLFLLALALPALAADPKLLSMLPSDAEAVIGVDIRAVMRSGITQELMRTATTANMSELNEMIALTGMDPRTDLHEFVAAGFATTPGAAGKKDANGIAFITGNFNQQRLAAAMTSKGGKKTMYKGRELWMPEARAGSGPDVLTFLDGNTLLAGDERHVKRYLDGASAPLSGGLRTRVDSVSGRYDMWMVSVVSPATLVDSVSGKQADLDQAAGALQGDMFQKIKQVQGGLKFGPQTTFGLEMIATTAEDANALMNVLQFFQSMMAGAGGQGANQMPAGIKDMLSSVRMTTQDKTLLVSMNVMEQDIVNFLKTAATKSTTVENDSPASPAPRSQPKQEEILIIQ
ncbi:MAG: hypothetical protein KIT83_07690 [Bryobacterales bacterium]|nr:hypothetical protein [Bryobacterales bacterium]